MGSEMCIRDRLYPHLQVYLQQCAVSEDTDRFRLDVLLDPQTSGGLLIALPQSNASKLLAEFPDSVIVGYIESGGSAGAPDTARIHIS